MSCAHKDRWCIWWMHFPFVVFASDAHLRPLCVCDFIFRIGGDTCKMLFKENNDRTRVHMNSIVFTWMFNYFYLLPPHVPRHSWIFVMYNLYIYFDLENVIWIFMCKVLYSCFFLQYYYLWMTRRRQRDVCRFIMGISI